MIVWKSGIGMVYILLVEISILFNKTDSIKWQIKQFYLTNIQLRDENLVFRKQIEYYKLI